MKITALQLHSALGEPKHNQQHLLRLFEQAVPEMPDVIVLPEMWPTGFYPKPIGPFSDSHGERTQTLLSQLAKEYSVNIVGGSAAVCNGSKIYNRSYTFDRSGSLLATYDKIHLFSPSGEPQAFTAGSEITTFRLDGVLCTIALCYDLRFCELIRVLGLTGADLLFLPAAWPPQRHRQWQILLQARAIENQFFVAGINAASCGGNSLFIDPSGKILAQADAAESLLTANLDLSCLPMVRESMNIPGDRRPELYKKINKALVST